MSDSYSEGKRLAKAGEFESALPLLKAAARENADSPEVWLALGACHFRLGNNDDFRESLRKALDLDPNHEPTLRFLRQTTGGEQIPAPDTGREKIRIDEQTLPVTREEPIRQEERKGCMAVVAGILLVGGMIRVFFV